MKWIILDRCTITKGDMDLTPLDALGEVKYFDILKKEEIIKEAAGADGIICNKAVIDREIMEKTGIRYVGLFATGYNNIDCTAASELGLCVCNVPGYSTDSVTQLTFSLLLQLAGSTADYTASVARGDWVKSKQFSYFSFPITELAGKTLGIFGLGTIGQAVAKVGLAFGMKVIACTRTPKNLPNITEVDKETLFRKSDFLTVHSPLTPETANLINAKTLKWMKPTAYLINTSRGGVIDETALAEALRNGRIAGAGLDVLCEEPMAETCPLRGVPHLLITPHIAWAATETRTRLIGLVAENAKAFMQGKPINKVNK